MFSVIVTLSDLHLNAADGQILPHSAMDDVFALNNLNRPLSIRVENVSFSISAQIGQRLATGW